MARALQLAERGRYSTHPNPRVGCVIVKNNKVVGEGWHQFSGQAHAEVVALNAAGKKASGANVYVTLEPCAHTGKTPPCAEALVSAGVARVFVAMQDPDSRVAGKGIQKLLDAGIEVHEGVMGMQARELNTSFLSRVQRNRSYITLKLASSLDGRTALKNGESQWITGAAARADVHRLRAEAGAVLTTATTVIADDPQLSVRDFHGSEHFAVRQPDRIVVDRNSRVQSFSKVWQAGVRRVWLTQTNSGAIPDGVELAGLNDLKDLPEQLATLGFNSVLVECGGKFAAELIKAKAVDELICYVAPKLLGGDSQPMVGNLGITALANAPQLSLTEVRQVGDDVRLRLKFN